MSQLRDLETRLEREFYAAWRWDLANAAASDDAEARWVSAVSCAASGLRKRTMFVTRRAYEETLAVHALLTFVKRCRASAAVHFFVDEASGFDALKVDTGES